MIPTPSMALRAVRGSLVAKIFAVCFVAIHLPLIAMVAYLGSGFSSNPGPVISILLAATLIGTVTCLSTLWWFIRPLRNLANAVQQYQADGTPVKLRLVQSDEIGVVANTVATTIAELDGVMRKLRQQATTDQLTGLGNRRWLTERIAIEQTRAEREKVPISVVLFDLDHFKKINDGHGHDVGDRVLMAVGEVIRDNLRRYDLAARIGGEEFCLVLPKTRAGEAEAIAERFRVQLEKLLIEPLPRGRVTASFGVYESTPCDSMQAMLLQADRALYRAKETGRNRVQSFGWPAQSR